ncbi:MAG: branched-chain amino acid ABC transporter permease [Acholeplasmataceae bacterium]
MLDLIISGLIQSAPLALATLGVVLIFKTSFTTNFAQGIIGTLSAYIVTYILMPVPDITGNVPNPSVGEYLFAIIVGVLFGFVFAMLIDILIFRKSKGSTSIGKQIITMGIVLIINGLIPTFFGVSDRSLPRIGAQFQGTFLNYPVKVIQWLFGLLNYNILYHQAVSFFISLVLILLIVLALRYTKWGLGVRATASNEHVSSMLGVNTRVITAMSWAIAGGLAAVSAILISSSRGTFGNVTTYFMIPTQIQAFFAAILGGFSTFYGPIVGIVIFSILNSILGVYLNPWGTTILYLIILLVVLFKPLGLFGKKIAKKV